MIHKNLTPFFWGPKVTSRKPPQVEMTVCVRGVFRLSPNGPLEAIEDPMEQGFMTGDTFAEADLDQTGPLHYASDFADWKLNAEALLKGAACPPGGPGRECTVRFAVGDWHKSLRVVGPRAYKPGLLLGGKASEPQLFDRMPLTWENAYGGPGYADNPAGRGFEGEELPTVEYADQPVKKVGQKNVAPATFLPVSPRWPSRAGKRGKNYGAAWRKQRAPFFADDFDWTHFHSAAPDQQLDGYLRGDEEMTFENLHPQAERWSQRLPGLRIRAFVKTLDGQIVEPEMNLDTLFADLDDGKLYLTWRGLSPIREIDMTDVGAVLIASEPLTEPPRPEQVYLDQLQEFEADPVGINAALPPGFMMVADAVEAAEQAELNETPMPDLQAVADNLPEDCPFPPWFLAAVGGNDDPLGVMDAIPEELRSANPLAGVAGEAGQVADPKKIKELQDAAGEVATDPAAAVKVLGALAGMLPPEKQAPFKAGLEQMQSAFETIESSQGPDFLKKAVKEAPSGEAKNAAESYAELTDQAGQGLDQAGDGGAAAKAQLEQVPTDLDAAAKEPLATLDDIELPEVPELPDTDAELAAHAEKLATDEARLRKKFGDHPMLGMFDLGRNMIETAPRAGDLVPDFSPLLSELSRVEDVLAAQGLSAAALAPLKRLTGKVNALVDELPQPTPLPDGEFVRQDLRGRDFSGQELEGAVFCKSDLTGSKFVNAKLTGADFRKADLTGADLTGAVLTDADFSGARLPKATLRDVHATGANFGNTELGQADASGGDFGSAKFTKAMGVKLVLAGAKLENADLRFVDFSKADLRGATMTGADLSFCTCAGVKADGADLSDVVFDMGKLTKSRLAGAKLTGVRSNMGSFVGSDLSDADLSGCAFEKVDLMKAKLDRADLRNARLVQLTLRDTQATGADFRGSDMSRCSATGAARFVECDFRDVTGNRSVWMDADLSRSNFRHSTFLHAFFQSSHGEDVDFTAAVLAQASFRKVKFERASFAYADLAGVIFQDAILDDGDFRSANCYDAKFLGAKAVRCSFEDAFLVAVQLDDPDQQQPGGATA